MVRGFLLVAVVGVLAVRPVRAAPMADVVVAWSASPLGKLGDAASDAAARAGAAYVDASPAAVPLPDPRPLVRRGIAAYASLEFEGAASALDAAADLVDQTGASTIDTTTLADLFLHRSLANEQRQNETRAWEDLVIAAGVEPARVLDPAGFPPRAIERFAQAKAHVAAMPRAKITFLTRPGVAVACRVRVDGAAVAAGDLELPFGRHWLETACDGYLPVRRRLDVNQPAITLAAAGAPIVPPDDAALLAQASTTAARAIVVVTVQARSVVVRRIGADGKQQDRATIALALPGPAPTGVVRAVGDAVAAMLAPPAIVAPVPWYRSRWAWAAGAAILTSAILIPIAVSASGDAPPVSVRPDLGGIKF